MTEGVRFVIDGCPTMVNSLSKGCVPQNTTRCPRRYGLPRTRHELDVNLAKKEHEFVRESVTFADQDHGWESLFRKVNSNKAVNVRRVAKELGATSGGLAVHDRSNLWLL